MAEVAVQEVRQGLPTALEPFFIGTPQKPGLLPQAEQVYGRTYAQTYAPLIQSGLMGAGRVAPITGTMLETAQRGLGALGPATGFGEGAQQLGMASQVFQNLSGVQAPTVQAGPLTQFQMEAPETFGTTQAQQYMSPYQQAVTAIAKQKAIDDAKAAQLSANLAAPRQGTYGGARQALLQSGREANLQTTLANLQAQGQQEAFLNAQAQFERDRAARQLAAQQNLGAALGVQQLGAQQGMQAQTANQAAALQAAQQRQAAAQGLAGLGSAYGALGTQQQATDLDRLNAQTAFGQLQQQLGQQALNARYEDVMRQTQYPEYQISGLSNILRGTPTATSQMTQQTPSPSFLQNLTSAGLGALGLYKLYNAI
jgi:hypothetical protein